MSRRPSRTEKQKPPVARTGTLKAATGMTVLPKYTFADAPQPDVLVVPGGA